MTTLSIITITLNNKEGLEKTAASIKGQGCQDFQWIVIDGGSRDGTPFYLGQLDCEKVIEPDNGIYDAMNKGVARAKGDYTIFMNAGDTFSNPDNIDAIICATEDQPDFIYGDALEGEHYKTARSHETIPKGMFTHHQAMAYKTAILRDMRYDSNLKIAADYDLTLRYLQRCDNIHYIPQALCVFEEGGLSQRNQKQGRNEQFTIRKTQGICSPIENVAIYLRQWLTSTLRQICPSLYWKLKKTLTQRPDTRYNPPTK